MVQFNLEVGVLIMNDAFTLIIVLDLMNQHGRLERGAVRHLE